LSIAGGIGLDILGGSNDGPALKISTMDDVNAVEVHAGETSHAVYLVGGSASGDALRAHAPGSGNAITALASGVGEDISADVAGDLQGNVTGAVGRVTDPVDLPDGTDVYHAAINYTVDDNSGVDEYTVNWFKNGQRVELPNSGHQATIKVVTRAGDTLIDDEDMTVVSGTGIAIYNAMSTERLSAGMAALVIVEALIDGSTRSFAGIVSRDAP
jgi:hypothetical protein